MARLFREHADAVLRTQDIVGRCSFSLGELAYEYPDEPIPPGLTPDEHLASLTWQGAAMRYPEGVPPLVRETIEKELRIIAQLNYARYFLTVHDIVRYAVANDAGRAINPMLVEGQIVGGTVHGIGNALFEWMGYDENAQPTTTNFGEYLLATAPEVPPIDVTLLAFPARTNPLGVKGVGEAGCVPAAAAIVAAIEDALRPFAVRITEAPVRPAQLFALLRAAGP
jgi:hypothetical protein